MESSVSPHQPGSRGTLTIAGVALFAAACCAGPVVSATLGLGAVVSLVTSLWVLVPTVLIAAGVVAWHAWRRSCRTRPIAVEAPTGQPTKHVR